MDQTVRPKRGLGALLAATTHVAPAHGDANIIATEVPILSIRANPTQPRVSFDPEALNELAASIKERGLIQPIVVRPLNPGESDSGAKYELIAGERRWRASQIAGLTNIQIVVKQVFDDRDILLLSLVENLQRDDLNPIEEASAYDKLSKTFHLTHEQIANGVGRSRVSVTNAIRMLELPEAVQDALRSKKISPGHAKVLLSLPDAKMQSHFAAKVQAENLTVRELERLTIGTLSEGTAEVSSDSQSDTSENGISRGRSTRGTRLPSAEVQELERKMREHFGTRVKIEEGMRKGRILIEFFSQQDLQRILTLLKIDL
jgi:ParB family chromosome partitioning protein